MEASNLNLSESAIRDKIQCRVSTEIIRLHDLAREISHVDSALGFKARMVADLLAKVGNEFHQQSTKNQEQTTV